MKASRFFIGMMTVGLAAWPAWGQGAYQPAPVPVPQTMPAQAMVPTPETLAPSASSVLTAPPNSVAASLPIREYPPGTVYSPACGPDGSCCGPFGADGPVTYELYGRTGPSLIVGGSELANRLNTGWQVAGGARTLFFNPSRTAAWVLDTGVSYTYNRGRQQRGGPLEVLTPSPGIDDDGNPATPLVPGPDGLQPHLVRGLHRTSFNFAIGRDWWVYGPGSVGQESTWNTRFGADTGGRWGTTHVDLVPQANLENYLRKHSVMHSIFIGVHGNWERPMGNWIFFTGARAEVDYTFTNVVPPKGGDLLSVNLLFSMGVRY